MNMIDDCFAIDPLVFVSKARREWQQGQRALSHILRRGRPRRGNAHHDLGRHNKPRPAAVAGTIAIERVESEWVLQRQTKQSDQPEGNRLRMDILFRNLDEDFDGTNIQFLHRRTSPTSVELVFFHSEGMASLIGVGLRFAVVELVAAGDSAAGLDVNRVIVRECSEQWWKELWMDNTSTRHGGYTSLLVQLKGHRGPAEYFGGYGRVAIAETAGWSSPGSASCIALNPTPQCGSIRDLLACILRHGAAPDPEQGSINLRSQAQQPTEGGAPDGDEAAHTAAAAAAAAATGHGDVDGSSRSQQQSRSISAGESSNLEPAGLGDHTKPSLDPEKSRSAKGKANVVPSTASAGDAQPADPWPTDFTVELLFKAVRGCDTTTVSVRNPDQATAGGNFHPSRRRKIWDWLRRRRKGHHRLHSNSSDNNDAARLARPLSPASDSVSSSTRTTTTTSLQGTPPHAHQLAMTPEVDDAAADPAVDDDDGLWLPAVPADHRKHPELNQCYLKPQLCIGFRHPDGFSIRMQAGFEVPTRLPIGVAHDNLHISFDCADSNNAVHLERAADEGTEKEGLRSSSARTVEWGQAGTMELSAGVGASSLKLGVTVDRRAADTLTTEHPTQYTKFMDLNNFEVKSEELGNRVAFRATHRPPFLHNFKPAPALGGRQWAGAFLKANLACSGDYRIDYEGFRDYAMLMEREVYVTSDTEVLKKGNQAFLKRLQINHSFAKVVVPNPQAQVVGLPSSSTSTASNPKISWSLYMGTNEEQAMPFVREAERGEERLWFVRHAPDKEVEHDIPVDMLHKVVQEEGLGDADDDNCVDRHVLVAQVLEIKKQEFRASRMQGRLNRQPRQPPADAWAPHHNSTNSTSQASTSHAL